MSCGKVTLGCAILGCATIGLATVASAQTPRVSLREGDTVIGMGGIQSIDTISVNDAGTWVSKVDTNGGTTRTDGAILRNGFVTLREGTLLVSPPDANLDDWRSIEINAKGDLAMGVRIDRPGPTVDGAMWNFTTVWVKGDTIESPHLGVGTTWETVSWVKAGDSTMHVMGTVRNPDITRAKNQTLVRYDFDDLGNVVAEQLLGTESMFIEELDIIVRFLGTTATVPLSASSFDSNRKGDFIAFIKGLQETLITLDYRTIIAREGGPAPIPGRTWNNLNTTRVSINDLGEYLYSGVLTATGAGDTTTWLMVTSKDGKFAQSGDILPDFQDAPIPPQTSTLAPVVLANNGDVFWRVDGSNDAILRNHEVVMQTGITTLNGLTLGTISNSADSFSASPSGRFLAVQGLLAGIDVVLFVDFGLVLDIPGCFGNEGELTTISGRAAVGESLVFSMDNGNVPNAITRVLFSTRERIPGSECGALTPFGEVLTSRAHRVGTLFVPPWDGTNPTTQTTLIPNDLALVDSVFFAQGFFRERLTSNVRLTNGLRIEISAP